MGFAVISAMLALGVLVFSFLHVWFRRRARSRAQRQFDMEERVD